MFRRYFEIGPNTKILDLGGGTGAHIETILAGSKYTPGNVYLADIAANETNKAASRRGFRNTQIAEDGPLPFEDGFFDIVFCNSVIEHCTIPKAEVWTLISSSEFRNRALERQQQFADEIRRVANRYFVQTPNYWFPIESHSWLPFISLLPRPWLLPTLRWINRFWIKSTQPDWYLLDAAKMRALFPDADIVRERFAGLTKSLIAVRTDMKGTVARRAEPG